MLKPTAATLLALALLAPIAPASAAMDVERVKEVLAQAPVFDGHNDLPWAIRAANDSRVSDFPFADAREKFPSLMTDAARLREGGVGAQFWSVYVPASLAEPEAVVATLEQIDLADRLIGAHPDILGKAETAADVRRLMSEGKIAGMFGVEGGHSIANSLAVLRQYYDLGARYMTLTHSATLDWADSATDAPKSDGLSPFGEEVVREMNRLGMLVDLSHVSEATMNDALDVSVAPVIFSHSSARAIDGHPRNVPDAVLKRLKDNGGVVMVTFVEPFLNESRRQWGGNRGAEEARLRSLNPAWTKAEMEKALAQWDADNPAPKASLTDAADHIDHIREVAGIDHIGLGGDFDGIDSTPTGLEDVSTYPALLAELIPRGYTEADIAKITSGNILRVLQAAEETAMRLQAERGPSEIRFATDTASE